jgi:hypothetical protein
VLAALMTASPVQAQLLDYNTPSGRPRDVAPGDRSQYDMMRPTPGEHRREQWERQERRNLNPPLVRIQPGDHLYHDDRSGTLRWRR